jgi:hypothetical protein
MNEAEFTKRMTELLPGVDSVAAQNWFNYAKNNEAEGLTPAEEFCADLFVEFSLISKRYSEDITLQLFNMAKFNKILNDFELSAAANYLNREIPLSTVLELAGEGRCHRSPEEWAEFREARKAFDADIAARKDNAELTSASDDESSGKQYDALGLYSAEHCETDSFAKLDYSNRILIIHPETLDERYWSPENQIFYAGTGFGCDPKATGRAVFGEFLADGERARLNRSDFIGVMKDEYVPQWARDKLELRQSSEQESSEGMKMS